VASVDNAAENLASSESTIRDLDISNEITNFTKAQILTQAGMSMLAQANAVPQNVLALFR
jgi:flagellin